MTATAGNPRRRGRRDRGGGRSQDHPPSRQAQGEVQRRRSRSWRRSGWGGGRGRLGGRRTWKRGNPDSLNPFSIVERRLFQNRLPYSSSAKRHQERGTSFRCRLRLGRRKRLRPSNDSSRRKSQNAYDPAICIVEGLTLECCYKIEIRTSPVIRAVEEYWNMTMSKPFRVGLWRSVVQRSDRR